MDDSLGPFKGNCLFVIDLDKGVDRIAKLARGVKTGAAQEIAEIEERIARYVRMLAQEAGEGGIGGKVGLVGEKGRVVRQHDLEVGRIPAEQADELGWFGGRPAVRARKGQAAPERRWSAPRQVRFAISSRPVIRRTGLPVNSAVPPAIQP